jgi:hypothetical protein
VNDGLLHVEFPGSCPSLLCCGSTNLEGQGNTIINEVVWNEEMSGGATGGGMSNAFNFLPSVRVMQISHHRQILEETLEEVYLT